MYVCVLSLKSFKTLNMLLGDYSQYANDKSFFKYFKISSRHNLNLCMAIFKNTIHIKEKLFFKGFVFLNTTQNLSYKSNPTTI